MGSKRPQQRTSAPRQDELDPDDLRLLARTGGTLPASHLPDLEARCEAILSDEWRRLRVCRHLGASAVPERVRQELELVGVTSPSEVGQRRQARLERIRALQRQHLELVETFERARDRLASARRTGSADLAPALIAAEAVLEPLLDLRAALAHRGVTPRTDKGGREETGEAPFVAFLRACVPEGHRAPFRWVASALYPGVPRDEHPHWLADEERRLNTLVKKYRQRLRQGRRPPLELVVTRDVRALPGRE